MRYVGQEGTESDDALHTQTGGHADDLLGEGPPAQMRFEAEQHDEIAVCRLDPRAEKLIGRPYQRSHLFVIEPHQRSRRAEVVERLGIDLGKGLGLETIGYVTSRDRGRITCVVPALEGGDQDGVSEFRGIRSPSHELRFSVDLRHRATLSGVGSASSRDPVGAVGVAAHDDAVGCSR